MGDLYVTIASDNKSARVGVAFELRYEIRNVSAVPVYWINNRPRFQFNKPETVAITLGLLKRPEFERHYAWQPPPIELLPPGESASGFIEVTLPLKLPTLDFAAWSGGLLEVPPTGPVTLILSVGHGRSEMPQYPEPNLDRAYQWQRLAHSARLYLELQP